MRRRHLWMMALAALTVGCHRDAAKTAAKQQADTPKYSVWTCVAVSPAGGGDPTIGAGADPSTVVAYQDALNGQKPFCAATDIACLHNFGLLPCLSQNTSPQDDRATQFTEFFRDPAYVKAYKARGDEIIAFLREHESPATLQKSLDAMRAYNAEAASYQHVDRVGYEDAKQRVLQALHDRIAAQAGTEKADLIRRKQTLRLLETVVSAYKTRLQQLATDEQGVVDRFGAYRGGEAALVAKLVGVRDQIVAATTLDQLPALQDAALTISADESARAESLASDAARLAGNLYYAQLEYDRSVKPYADFIAKYGFSTPHPVDDAVAIANNVSAYCEARDQRVFENVAKLVDGVMQKSAALQAQLVADATRATLDNATHLRASVGFVDELNALVQRVWAVPPKSTTLKLPYLRERYDAIADLQGRMRVCNNAAGPLEWMQDGCKIGQPELAKVNTYLSRTLPGTLTIDVAMMRKAKVDEAMLQAIVADAAAGNLRSAVLRHDAAVNASEVTP